MDTTAVLLAVCLGASSSRGQNDINLWVVAARAGNRFIDSLAGFLESERDIASETETIILVRGSYQRIPCRCDLCGLCSCQSFHSKMPHCPTDRSIPDVELPRIPNMRTSMRRHCLSRRRGG